jgi:DNA polymerase-1
VASTKDGTVISYDIESIDHKGNYTDYPTQIACAGDGWCYVSRDNEQSVRSMIEALIKAAQNGATLVGHNSWSFDSAMIRRWGYPDFPLGEDTMVLAYLLDETAPKGLESLCVQHLGIKGWKDEFEHPLGSEGFALYNARDVVYTLRLYKVLCNLLGDRTTLVPRILRPAHEALSAMSERGIYIDPKAVARERLNAETKKSEALEQILKLTGSKKFNPGSSKQVGEWLVEAGVSLPSTPTGKPRTDDKVLNELADDPLVGTFATCVLDYRGAVKTLGTYVENYEECIKNGGRVHPTYSITRTLTGRSSASKQNVQNLPREYKDFFGAPPGRVFSEVDWSSIEFRVAAWAAREKSILSNFKANPEWDPHRYFASFLYEKTPEEITKEERQIAKSANFGLLFMGNGVTLVEYAKGQGLNLSLEFCEKVYRKWHEVFPGFTRFYADTKKELQTYSEVKTATGHIRHFGDVSIMPRHIFAESVRQAVNVKVQGLAAHIAYISMARLHLRGLPLTGFVHDAFLFEFETERDFLESRDFIEETMCLYPAEFLRDNFQVEFDVPLTVEFKHRIG